MPRETIDYYSAGLPGVDHDRSLQAREAQAIDLLLPALRARDDGSLLDVGCGSGVFLEALDAHGGLTSRGWSLSGVDYSPDALAAGAHRPYDLDRCNLDEGIPRHSGTLDVVTMGEVIEHIFDPDALLAECWRVLKPGGHLLVTTPNVQAWYNRLFFLAGIQPVFVETSTRSTTIGAGALKRLKKSETPVGHVRLFNRTALRDILESQGFNVLRVVSAPFAALPGPMQAIETRVIRRTTLGSILVVLARKAAVRHP